MATGVTELDGTSGTATYGALYTRDPAAGQRLGPLPLQRRSEATEPINPAQDFVLRPLREIPANPGLAAALTRYTHAPVTQRRQVWATAYDARFAQSGGLDGVLLTPGDFSPTDYTRPLMFISDGSLLAGLAQRQHLLGSQWGTMNETGNVPGQAWQWLSTFWYQVKPLMMALSAVFVLVPFLPRRPLHPSPRSGVPADLTGPLPEN